MEIAVDASKCSGCRVCELLCAMEHFVESNPKKAALNIVGHFPAPGTYEIQMCNQCGVCAEVCPVEAIKERDGAYYIDAEECTGCMVCVEECPTHVMFTHAELDVPIKCDWCGECVRYCPMKALSFAE